MILVDSSIWIDHLRFADHQLQSLLDGKRVYIHPMVIGEIALGNLRRRELILGELSNLPHITTLSNQEVMMFVERHRLFGLGIGFVDAHLLAAAQVSLDASLWTRDRRLSRVASQLGLAVDFLR